jgi:hypothetical protein
MIKAVAGVQKIAEHFARAKEELEVALAISEEIPLPNTASQLAGTIADLAQGIDECNEWLALQNG